MVFWLQCEGEIGEIDIDIRILYDALKARHNRHQYCWMKKEQIFREEQADHYEEIIPVGDISYVSAFLERYYNISCMNPIEVPDILRNERFLKRMYAIVPKDALPASGRYFIKYVSRLKVFAHVGELAMLRCETEGESPFLKDGLYQFSEIVDIVAEYRCFVHHDRIVAVHQYDGDCMVLPDPEEIKAMVEQYKRDPQRPGAYTMDIAVIAGRGTALLEVHPWMSVGLYGYMFDCNLPFCYRDGFEYYKQINKVLNEYLPVSSIPPIPESPHQSSPGEFRQSSG